MACRYIITTVLCESSQFSDIHDGICLTFGITQKKLCIGSSIAFPFPIYRPQFCFCTSMPLSVLVFLDFSVIVSLGVPRLYQPVGILSFFTHCEVPHTSNATSKSGVQPECNLSL